MLYFNQFYCNILINFIADKRKNENKQRAELTKNSISTINQRYNNDN